MLHSWKIYRYIRNQGPSFGRTGLVVELEPLGLPASFRGNCDGLGEFRALVARSDPSTDPPGRLGRGRTVNEILGLVIPAPDSTGLRWLEGC